MRIRSIIGLLLMFALLVCFWYWKERQEPEPTTQRQSNYAFTEQEIALLEQGDIVLRRGYGLISDAIVRYSNSPYKVSHCGVLVKQDNQWFVVHTVSNTLTDIDGMQKESLSKFVGDSHEGSMIVVRYVSVDSLTQQKLVDKVLQYLQAQIPFDDLFDFEDKKEFFCTEMVWNLFYDVLSVDILKGTYSVMSFDSYFDKELFLPIINHYDSLKN